MRDYGHDFRVLREERNISISQLAKKTNVSKSTFSRFESGETQLGIDKFIAALEVMGITLSEFEKGEINPDNKELTLFDPVAIYDEKNVNDLKALKSFYEKRSVLDIFTYFDTEKDNTAQDKLLKLLSKKMLADLSLHFDLPKEEIDFIESYFLGLTTWTDFDREVFELFEFSMSFLETISQQPQAYKQVVHLLARKLAYALENCQQDRAKEIANLLTKL